MTRLLGIGFTSLALLAAACGDDKPAAPGAPGVPAAGAPATPPPASTPTADLSTPDRAVLAFIAAAKAKDKDAMIRCIASGAEKELRDLRNKTASDKEWQEWMEGMAGASLGETKTEGTDRATVVITVGQRRESVKLVKDGANWLLYGM